MRQFSGLVKQLKNLRDETSPSDKIQRQTQSYGHTGDDDVDGKLDLPVGPGGRDGDVVPRVLLREELEGARAGRLVGVLQAVTVP